MDTALWDKKGEAKREAVQRLFSRIAPTYDRVNGLMSLGLHRKWREEAVKTLKLRPGDFAADICSGTGDFLPPLRDAVGPRGRLLAVDFCAPMLNQARAKDAHAVLVVGDACTLAIPSRTFDGLSVGWGIRNVPDIDAAHREAFRVLKPGGHFCSLDMALPRNPLVAGASRFLFRFVVPLLGRLIGRTQEYAYLPESTDRFLSRQGLIDSMRRAGFVDVATRDFMFGNICLHTGRRPEEAPL